ncbi:hypothetical protein VTH06DRAFT_3598 [Thermothelomyces fergusii]
MQQDTRLWDTPIYDLSRLFSSAPYQHVVSTTTLPPSDRPLDRLFHSYLLPPSDRDRPIYLRTLPPITERGASVFRAREASLERQREPATVMDDDQARGRRVLTLHGLMIPRSRRRKRFRIHKAP